MTATAHDSLADACQWMQGGTALFLGLPADLDEVALAQVSGVPSWNRRWGWPASANAEALGQPWAACPAWVKTPAVRAAADSRC